MTGPADPVPFARVQDLVGALLDLGPEQRAVRLDQECAGDPALRAEVESLLAHVDAADGFLEAPLRPTVALAGDRRRVPEPATAPEHIGGYRIRECYARGGMGNVYRAEQEHPRRTVALKTIRRQFQDEATLRRFRRECQVLGLLQHRGIAAVFDAGSFDRGEGAEPFLVMEFIEGRTLIDHAEHHVLDVDTRIGLMLEVCDAVHHAHQKGVVHRDLKPGNILVDASGQPKILDFGIARLLDAEPDAVSLRTLPGQLLGTLPYMSPEQVAGDPAAVDTRSDVYALGVVLFELLAGQLPLATAGQSIPAAVRMIREQEPTRLGAVVASLRGDLETIVSKALAKEADRRYASAHALAADLRRYLAHAPIEARPSSVIYQLRKFGQRHRALAVAVLAIIVVSVSGAIIATAFAVRAARNEAAAVWSAARAAITVADTTLQLAPRAAQRQLEQVPARLRNWEWHHLATRLLPIGVRPMAAGVAAAGAAVAFTPDGVALYAVAEGRELRVEDLATGRLVAGVQAPEALGRVQLSPEGTRVLALAADRTRLMVWDAASGVLLRTHADPATMADPCFSGNGERIAYATDAGAVVVLQVATGERVFALQPGHRTRHGAPSLDPTGARVILRSEAPGRGGTVARSYDCTTGRPIPGRGHGLGGRSRGWAPLAVYGPEGARIAASHASQTIFVLDDASGEAVLELPGTELSGALAFAARSPRLASASLREVQVWDVVTGEKLVAFDEGAHAVALHPAGSRVAAATPRGGMLWEVRPPRSAVLAGHDGVVLRLAFHPDGSVLGSLGSDDTVRLWSTMTGASVSVVPLGDRLPPAHTVAVGRAALPTGTLAFTADGAELTVAGSAAWRLAVGPTGFEALREVPPGAGPRISQRVLTEANLALLPDGRALRAGLDRIHVFLPPHLDEVASVCRYPDAGRGTAIAVSPDGSRIATGHAGGWIRLWQTGTGAELARTVAHDTTVYCLDFSPDGTRLVSGGLEFAVKLWDVATLEQVLELRGHRNSVRGVAFNPDGTQIASCSSDGTVRLWDSVSPRERQAQADQARNRPADALPMAERLRRSPR